jgi:hypothetical protein
MRCRFEFLLVGALWACAGHGQDELAIAEGAQVNEAQQSANDRVKVVPSAEPAASPQNLNVGTQYAAATSSPQNVNIVGSTVTVPVAAQGTTQVAGTVTVANPVTSVGATQNGAWHMSLDGVAAGVSVPVSIAGTSNVALTGVAAGVSVPVSIAGTSNVALTGVAAGVQVPVSIGGTPNVNVVTLPEHARQPFQKAFSLQMAPLQDGVIATYQVPQGTRLVIDHLSASAELAGAGQFPRVSVAAGASVLGTYGTSSAGVRATMTRGVDAYGGEYYEGNSEVLLYADGGTTVNIFFNRNDPSGALAGIAEADVSLSGYFISL